MDFSQNIAGRDVTFYHKLNVSHNCHENLKYSTESSILLRPCAGNKFCVNTEGSFRCMRCDKSCDGCDGDGPDNCAKCADGHVKNKVSVLLPRSPNFVLYFS